SGAWRRTATAVAMPPKPPPRIRVLAMASSRRGTRGRVSWAPQGHPTLSRARCRRAERYATGYATAHAATQLIFAHATIGWSRGSRSATLRRDDRVRPWPLRSPSRRWPHLRRPRRPEGIRLVERPRAAALARRDRPDAVPTRPAVGS